MVHTSILKFLLMSYFLMNETTSETTCLKIEMQLEAIELSVGNAF